MAKRFSVVLIALLVVGFTVAGCGSSSKSSTNTSTDTSAQTDTSATTSTQTAPKGSAGTDTAKTTTGSTGSGGSSTPDVSKNPQLKQAVAQCKKSVGAAPQLRASTKQKLADICEKAARGDKQGIKRASKDICLSIIRDTGLSGAAADTAKQQCNTIGNR